MEVGINVNSSYRSGKTDVFLQPNVKWRLFDNKTDGIAAAAGVILYTRVSPRIFGNPSYGFLYAETSKKVRSGTYAPRFHAGTYGIVHAGSSWIGPKAGMFFGYEQPVQSKASIVADWLTGKNTFGLFHTGPLLYPSVEFRIQRRLQLRQRQLSRKRQQVFILVLRRHLLIT